MRCPTLQVLNAASRRTRCRRSGDIIIVIYLWCDARCLPTRGPGAWSGYCDAGQECWNLGRSEVVAIAIQDNYHQNTADRQVQHAEFRPVIVINRCIESIYYKEISSHIYMIVSCMRWVHHRGMCKSNVTSPGTYCDTCISINNVNAVTDKNTNNEEPHRAVAPPCCCCEARWFRAARGLHAPEGSAGDSCNSCNSCMGLFNKLFHVSSCASKLSQMRF